MEDIETMPVLHGNMAKASSFFISLLKLLLCLFGLSDLWTVSYDPSPSGMIIEVINYTLMESQRSRQTEMQARWFSREVVL